MPSNGYDGQELERYLQSIDSADDELDTLKGEHMTACKGPRGRIKDTLAAARDAEINMPAFRAFLAKHRAERKQAKRVAELEADDANEYEMMRNALGEFGETPLGQAALERAKGDGTLASL